MKELKDAVLGFLIALGLVVGCYLLFVRECNVIVPPGVDEKRCKCVGKMVNLKLLLGSEDALELPKTEHCAGVITGWVSK